MEAELTPEEQAQLAMQVEVLLKRYHDVILKTLERLTKHYNVSSGLEVVVFSAILRAQTDMWLKNIEPLRPLHETIVENLVQTYQLKEPSR